MNPIEEILSRLEKYPDTNLVSSPTSITLYPATPDGFEISLISGTGGSPYTVFFAGWHEHFELAEQALECFAFGVSEGCRLKVTSRGSFDSAWTVESLEQGNWVEGSTTGLVLVPVWRKKRVRYLQNHLIKESTP